MENVRIKGKPCTFAFHDFFLSFSVGKEWYQGLTLHSSMGDADVSIVHTLWNRLKAAVTPTSSFNITLNLDTNQVRGFLFKARAKLVWPRITPPIDRLEFPLTQIMNTSELEVTFSNPAQHDVYVHIVPMLAYPNGKAVVGLLPATFNKQPSSSPLSSSNEFSNITSPLFRIVSVFDANFNTPLIGFGDDIEDKFGVPLHPDTKAFILKPGQQAKVKVRFSPVEEAGHFRHGFFVRNNLTGVEFMEVFGEAVNGEMKFGKWKSMDILNSEVAKEATLEFDMKEKHLKDCHKANQNRYSPPVFTVKRSFKAKNTGHTPFYVKGFEIEGVPCEGYGFRVLNCEGFDLKPSEVREVNIAFTPDFTLSRISRRLTMHTTLNLKRPFNYTLVASVPSHMLSTCASVIPRPFWEVYMFYGVNVFMILVLIIVILTSYVEAERVARGSAVVPVLSVNLSNRSAVDGNILDLQAVSDLVSQEIAARNSTEVNSNGNNLRHRRGRPPNSTNGSLPPKPPDLKPYVSAGSAGNGVTVQRNSGEPSLITRSAMFIKSSLSGFLWSGSGKKSNARGGGGGGSATNGAIPKTRGSTGSERDGSSRPASALSNHDNNKPGTPSLKAKNNNNANKSGGKSKQQRKKSLPTINNSALRQAVEDLDESSSTTTESSAVDDVIESRPDVTSVASSVSGGKGGKNNSSNNKKQQQQQQQQPQPQHESQQQGSGKKKVKKQNSTEKKQQQVKNVTPVPESKQVKKPASPTNPQPPSQRVKPQPQQQQQQQQQQPSGLPAQPPINAEVKTAKVPPVGKILPEVKKMPDASAAGSQYGAVGTKPLLPLAKKSIWPPESGSGGSPPTGPTLGGLQHSPTHVAHPQPQQLQQQQHHQQPSGVPLTAPPHQGARMGRFGGPPLQPTSSLPTNMEDAMFNQRFANQQQQQQQQQHLGMMVSQQQQPMQEPSLMRALQMNRRQETEEYLKSRTGSEVRDWPGFGSQTSEAATGSYIENLWDKPEHSGFGGAGQTLSSKVWGGPFGFSDINTHYNPYQRQQQQQHQQQQPRQQQPSPDHSSQGDGVQDGGLGFDPKAIASIWGSPKKQPDPKNVDDDEVKEDEHDNNRSWSGVLFK